MKSALALFALAIVAHACALQLIDVKPYAAFQHYRPWRGLLAGWSPAVWVVLTQALIVSWLTWRYRARLHTAFARPLPVTACIIVFAFAVFSLAVPAAGVSRYLGETILAGAIALTATLNLVLMVLKLPDEFLERAAAWVDTRLTLHTGATDTRRWDRRLPYFVAMLVTLVAAAASVVVFERVPHIDDSVSNLFQAKYFAAGHLYLPSPPDFESFRMDLTVVRDGKWFGYGFPGWPAVLAIGVFVGVPWLVNPLLGGILILLGHVWLRRRYDRGTANVAVLLLAGSSWLIFMSAELMGHPLTAVLWLLALVAFDRASGRESHWVTWSVFAGVTVGVLMLTRALDGALTAAALGIIALADRRVIRAWPALLITGASAAVVGALILPYNLAVTGRATYPAHAAWADYRYGPGVDVLGFGPNVGIPSWPNLDPLPGHGPPDVVLNLNKNLFMVNADLFGWASGSLLFIWLAFVLGRWRRDDTIVFTVPAVYAVGYSAFWFSGGPDLGARYWYPMLLPLAALTARGAQMAAAALEARGALTHVAARVGALMVAASISAAFVMLPWRATTKYYRYRGISGEVGELAAKHQFDHALVFVRTDELTDYQAAFIFNPATLDNPGTVYALDAGAANRSTVVAHFSDRPVWVIGRAVADVIGNAPFRVIAGPLAPGTVPPGR